MTTSKETDTYVVLQTKRGPVGIIYHKDPYVVAREFGESIIRTRGR